MMSWLCELLLTVIVGFVTELVVTVVLLTVTDAAVPPVVADSVPTDTVPAGVNECVWLPTVTDVALS